MGKNQIQTGLLSGRVQQERVMARTSASSKRKSAPKVSKLRKTSSILQCIAEGKDFLKTKRTPTTKKLVYVPPVRPIPKRRPTKKKIAKKTALPVRRAIKSKPAKVAVPKKHSAGLFGPVPAGGGLFGGGLFGSSSSGTLTSATTFLKGKSPEEIGNTMLPKGSKYRTSSRDMLPTSSYGYIDICFCLDATGSMSSELAQAKSTINSLIEKLTDKVRIEGITIRYGVVAYHDHMDTPLLEIQDFTDAPEAMKFTNGLRAMGGGDEPEAVHDAIQAACKRLSWVESPSTPMLRYIFHVLDAQPHGKEFDNFGQPQEGCKCGIQTDDILQQMNMRQIHYRMIKVRNNPRVDKMEEIFKKKLGNFDSADIGHASQMDIRVADMVIHEVMPDF